MILAYFVKLVTKTLKVQKHLIITLIVKNIYKILSFYKITKKLIKKDK